MYIYIFTIYIYIYIFTIYFHYWGNERIPHTYMYNKKFNLFLSRFSPKPSLSYINNCAINTERVYTEAYIERKTNTETSTVYN